MGYYTEFIAEIVLRKDTPEDVIQHLKTWIIERDYELPEETVFFSNAEVPKPTIQHPFFECERWFMLFCSNNFNSDKVPSRMHQPRGTGSCWVLEFDSEFKNYDSEIDKFVDWISPYVAGHKAKQFIGTQQGEDEETPRNIYIDKSVKPST